MARPVVFVHGLWLHATSWQSWIELFREAGHDPIAPGWPGEPATIAEARANPQDVAGHGITAIADQKESVDLLRALDHPATGPRALRSRVCQLQPQPCAKVNSGNATRLKYHLSHASSHG